MILKLRRGFENPDNKNIPSSTVDLPQLFLPTSKFICLKSERTRCFIPLKLFISTSLKTILFCYLAGKVTINLLYLDAFIYYFNNAAKIEISNLSP